MFASLSNGKQLAYIVHLGEGVFSALQHHPKKKKQQHLKMCTMALFWCVTKEAKIPDMTYSQTDLDQSPLKVINWSDLKLDDLKSLKLGKRIALASKSESVSGRLYLC